ncbi:hypothetical protein CGMCC3_g15618 [Colletotrichum fructicola]|nr:uncharacterized protein CGMCC3_g15618 [Colletotrichum fructicola]KAE9568252.1 hypothetical protein CGMCC3_g15618 [Colletotrichum fructicola]
MWAKCHTQSTTYIQAPAIGRALPARLGEWHLSRWRVLLGTQAIIAHHLRGLTDDRNVTSVPSRRSLGAREALAEPARVNVLAATAGVRHWGKRRLLE